MALPQKEIGSLASQAMALDALKFVRLKVYRFVRIRDAGGEVSSPPAPHFPSEQELRRQHDLYHGASPNRFCRLCQELRPAQVGT